jgi:hypothetical protein
MMYIAPIRKGDSVSFQVESFNDITGNRVISAANGWALKFAIKGSSNDLEVSASAAWLVSLTTTNTGTLTAGFARYALIATKDSDKITIDEGRIEILPDLDAATSSFEHRSQNRQDLEAVQSAIRTLISGGAVSEYSVGGRSLKRFDLSELRDLERTLLIRVKNEDRKQALKDGRPDPRNKFVRF